MKKSEEIKKRYDELKEELSMLEKAHTEAIEQEKTENKVSHVPGYWNPNYDEIYYCSAYQCPIKFQEDKADEKGKYDRSICKTEEEAIFVSRIKKARYELIKRIQELNAGWEPDFLDMDRGKWCFTLIYSAIYVSFFYSVYQQPAYFYFESESIGNKLIEELGEDLIKLAIWEIPGYEK